jgi:hypothetical protein
VSRRSTERDSSRENSGTRAKRCQINGEPARNGRDAAAQSYKRPLNGCGGRRKGEKVMPAELVLL